MEKYISLKEKKEDEKKYQMECKKIEEENDAYEAMCRKCDNREKDEYKEQTIQPTKENIQRLDIKHEKCTYVVWFCRIGKEYFFEYYKDDGIKCYEIKADSLLLRLSAAEEKEVIGFKIKMTKRTELNKRKNK